MSIRTRTKRFLPFLVGSLLFVNMAVTHADVMQTPDEYTPYLQTSAIWHLLDSNPNDLQNPNTNYLGTTYNITSMYAGMFLDMAGNCSLSDATTAGGKFNPLNDPYNGAIDPNWLGRFHGDVSLVIGGDPRGLHDYIDDCSPTQFANVVTGLMAQFNAQPNQQAKLVGIVFDVENASFHDGSAWPKIAAAITSIHNISPTIKIIIAIPFNTDYWSNGWANSAFHNFFNQGGIGDQVSEVNILINDNHADDMFGSIQNHIEKAYSDFDVVTQDAQGNMKNLYYFPARKVSIMLDTDIQAVTPEVLARLKDWVNGFEYSRKVDQLKVPVNNSIHLFSRDKDIASAGGRDLLTALIQAQ